MNINFVIKNGKINISPKSYNETFEFLEKICALDNSTIEQLKKMVIQYKGKVNRICNRCGDPYKSTNFKQKYCPKCQMDTGKIRYENIKKNEERYLHKQIWQYLRITKKMRTEEIKENFLEESNYYWAIVQEKTPKTKRKSWYLDYIQTKDDYMKWLQRKYTEIKNSKHD